MLTIYRKYRASNFSEIIGQDHVVRILKQAVIEGRLSHAFLFTGPRGTGKTSMARILSKAINCLDIKDGEPCNACANCKAINKGRFMDLIEIDAASNRGIDEIRDLKEKIGFMPVEGKHKVYIIDEVHMMTDAAFNALLKTLEEPPKQVIFILATTEPHKLPLTIISRTQRFDFKLADDDSLRTKLSKILKQEGISLEPGALELVIKAGQGSFRDAETVLEKLISSLKDSKHEVTRVEAEIMLGYVSSEIVNFFLQALIDDNRVNSFKILHSIYDNGGNLVQFTKECLEASRERMILEVSGHGNTSELKRLLQIIKELTQAGQEIKTSLISILPLEIAIMNLTSPEVQVVKASDNSKVPIVESKIKVEKTEQSGKSEKSEKIEKVESPKVEIEAESSKKVVKDAGLESLQVLANDEALQLLQSKWGELLTEAKKYNHFLTAILSGSRIEVSTEDGILNLFVNSAFHKKRLESGETRKILDKLVTSICGIKVAFKCIIDKNLVGTSKSSSSNANIVEELLS